MCAAHANHSIAIWSEWNSENLIIFHLWLLHSSSQFTSDAFSPRRHFVLFFGLRANLFFAFLVSILFISLPQTFTIETKIKLKRQTDQTDKTLCTLHMQFYGALITKVGNKLQINSSIHFEKFSVSFAIFNSKFFQMKWH